MTNNSISTLPTRLLTQVFHHLPGRWALTRHLRSANTTEPSGKCHGTATFTVRTSSTDFNHDHSEAEEMLYHETGEFEMTPHSSTAAQKPLLTFSRTYIWRLTDTGDISIWFTRPGTEERDYLFHNLQSIKCSETSQNVKDGERQRTTVTANGDHLCVEDVYDSTYVFHVQRPAGGVSLALGQEVQLLEWGVRHVVKGPQKDQYIQTTFTRPVGT